MNKKQTGFTIIELIVAITIIAVLSAIVLVNVTQYISKGKDSSIKANMNTILVNSSIYFSKNGTYVGFMNNFSCASGDSTFLVPMNKIFNAGATVPYGQGCLDSTATAFCVKVTLNSGTVYCIDNTGFKGTPTHAINNCGWAMGVNRSCQ